MKGLVIVVALATICIVSCESEEKYTTKYDNIDLDTILKSDRLLQNYVNCILDKGPCSADGTELKKHIRDALQTQCSKCSDVQRNGIRKIIKHLIKNKPQWWEELRKKYDPNDEFFKKYENELKQLDN